MPATPVTLGARGDELRADCADCFGLCCVALAFTRSVDFAIDKPAGEPCTNLAQDDRCDIHPRLRESGMKGCTVFDCHGAGQRVSRRVFAGRSWRDDAATREQMFAVFPVARQLHELLRYLAEATSLPAVATVRPEAERLFAAIERVTLADPATILETDASAHRDEVARILSRASELTRAEALRTAQPSPLPRPAGALARKLRPNTDLLGAALAGLDLRAANLRGAYLIAADLRGSDLASADLLGADLRDTDARGTDLSGALFLTQLQVNAARGDALTRLPAHLDRPAHWA